MRKFLAACIFLSFVVLAFITPQRGARALSPEPGAGDGSSAVILTYQRIGEDAYPDTNISAEQFNDQIEELQQDGYAVLPLPQIIDALKRGEKLPQGAVAITFEGAYQSSLENGMRLLFEKNMPFTVFFASDKADGNTGEYLGWEELQALKRTGKASFGILPSSYERLSGRPRGEILDRVNRARLRYRQELGGEPVFFSYPFGEYSLAYKNIIAGQGFLAAFGLQSGAAANFSDFMALPRFTMTGAYGDIDRFRMVTHALPLPVSDLEPQDPLLSSPTPSIGFSLPESLLAYKKSLSCFVSGKPAPDMQFLGKTRVELRLAEPLSEERTRVNCTMPAARAEGEAQRWRWLGMLLVLKEAENEDAAPNPPQDELP